MSCKNCGRESTFLTTLRIYKCKDCDKEFCRECGITRMLCMECPKCGSTDNTERND